MFNLKTLAFAALAFTLGGIGLILVFSDVGAGESAMSRIIVASIFFFLCGFGIGYFNPRIWMVSGFSAWAGILFGAFLTQAALRRYGGDAFAAQEPLYISAGLVIMLGPLGLSLLRGYVGKLSDSGRAGPAA